MQVGSLIAYWRGVRRMSQLALATQADVSPRHVSFIESGRSNPSRDMVMLLANVLDVPLRERNTLLTAAGFAAAYRQSELGAPQLAAVERALDAILTQHMPYPAVVMDRRWNIVQSNPGAVRLFSFLLGGTPPPHLLPPNVLRMMFHPDGIRPCVVNWDATAEAMIQRVHREAVGAVLDDDLRAVVAEILGYPGVPARWARPDHAVGLLPIVPVELARDGRRFSYFSTVTTLGTPVDVTAQELRIECFFPVDDATRQAAREML
jgi:transcriptional regulator with XRE-family HTH domain